MVIRLERRTQYMLALEEASVRGNIRLFTEFIKDEMNQKISETYQANFKSKNTIANTFLDDFLLPKELV